MTWIGRLLRRKRLEGELERELAFHLAERERELRGKGHSPQEAHRMARAEFGWERVKEECRDARGTRWLEDLWRDARYAVRALAQNPGLAMVACVTLALGTGATTVMFSLIRGVLFEPYAYRDPGKLVRLEEQTDYKTALGDRWSFSLPNYLDLKRQVRTMDLGVSTRTAGTLSAPGAAEYVVGAEISADLFPLLGLSVEQGRGILPEDDRPGAEAVGVIGRALWEQHFGAKPDAIGSKMLFDGKPYTVVGILDRGFRLDDTELSFYTALGADASPWLKNRARHGLRVWGRLHQGTGLETARAEIAVVGIRLAQEYPQSNQGRTFVADPLRPDAGDARGTLWLLLGAVGLVLLIACGNIASLLLARSVKRERELAMRVALGAGRGRLARQCLTESAVLALAGGVLGLGVAWVGLKPFLALWPGGLPRAWEVRLDGRVLAFALAVSLLSGLVFGMAPALRAQATELEQVLRAGARTMVGRSRRLHGVFVAAEVTLAVVLLVCAGMLGRMLLRVSANDPGVDVRHVLTARTALSPATLADAGRTRAAWKDVLERALGVPGVEAIAMIDTVPMRDGSNPVGYRTSPAEEVPKERQKLLLANCTTAEYLRVMGIPLKAGRFLNDQDREGSQRVAVIDEVLAREAFGGDALGKQLWLDLFEGPVTVVGIVGHVRQWGLAGDDDAKIRAQLYYPFAQVPDTALRRWSELMSIAVRTTGEPLSVLEPLRGALRGALNDQVLYEVRTLEQLDAASLARQRFLMVLFGVFAALALLLASTGIAGVLGYLTSQRVPEIGVRMALGASRSEVIRMVMRSSLGMVGSGMAVGAIAAVGAARVLAGTVEGMEGVDPLAFAGMLAVLLVAAMAASFAPALRASRVDPIRALREE